MIGRAKTIAYGIYVNRGRVDSTETVKSPRGNTSLLLLSRVTSRDLRKSSSSGVVVVDNFPTTFHDSKRILALTLRDQIFRFLYGTRGMMMDDYYDDGYMDQEEDWDREGVLDPAWENQQKKVSEVSDIVKICCLQIMLSLLISDFKHWGLKFSNHHD